MDSIGLLQVYRSNIRSMQSYSVPAWYTLSSDDEYQEAKLEPIQKDTNTLIFGAISDG